jgi:methanogenic corrinoid protein MtbC1
MLLSESAESAVDGREAPHPAPISHPDASFSAALHRTVWREVVPSLRGRGARGGAGPADLAKHCAARIAAGDGAALSRALAEARAKGLIPEQICLTLLTDVARHLGELWLDDRCSFVDVTLGVQQAQAALLDLAPGFAPPAAPGGGRVGRVLLGGAPGERHGFGALMVAEFFRLAGWDVALAPLPTAEAWLRAAAEQRFDVVGISLGRDDGIEELASLIGQLRRASRNPDLRVLVGGPAFLGSAAHRAFRVGADATAPDAAAAVRAASALLPLGTPVRAA